jgi:hypothetical protein
VLNGRACVKPARVLAQKDLSTGGIGGHEDPELRSLCFASLPTFALEITGDEAENTLRKSVFAAADGIQDLESRPAVSQCCVEIAAASPDTQSVSCRPGPYVPPDDAQHDEWMRNEQDLVDATSELEAELTTHYVKDKISATTGSASVANEARRAYKHRMLLQKVNSVMRHGLLKAIRGKTLLSHLENKDYVTAEIENLDAIAATQATRLVSLTCVRLIIDIFTVMAKRGGSGNSSFQDLCALPNPSKDSWPSLEKRLLEAKSQLLALLPANPEAVTDFMIAMQLHTFLKEGTKIRDDKYREAFRMIFDDVEQELDAPGQFGPLSLAKMKEFGDKLQVTLQSSCLSEVPLAAVNELADMQARLRKFESGGGGKPPDKPPPNRPAPADVVPPRGGGRGRGRGSGGRGARTGRQEPTAPTGKCFVCGQVGCKPSTCPKGNPDAQKEHAERKTERERANMQRQPRRLQGAVDVSVDEVVSDEENAEQFPLPPNVPSILPLSNPELSPEVLPKFLGTVCHDLSHDSETPTECTCIAVAPVLPPYLRPGLAKQWGLGGTYL